MNAVQKKRWVLIPLFSISLFYSSWLCALLVLVLVRVSFFSPCLARKCSLHLIAHSNFSRWFVLLLFFPWRMVMWSSRSLGKKRRQQSNRKKNNVHFRFGIIFYFHSIDLRSLFVWQLSSCTVAYLCVSTPKQWISRVWVCDICVRVCVFFFSFDHFFVYFIFYHSSVFRLKVCMHIFFPPFVQGRYCVCVSRNASSKTLGIFYDVTVFFLNGLNKTCM